MRIQHGLTKSFKHVVTISLLTMSLYTPNAHAQIIDTETLVSTSQTTQDRNHINDALNREEVKTKLHELGVNTEQIQARVNSLTDAEAQSLAKDIDTLPAGGRIDTVTILLIIIIIILLV